MRKLRSAAPFFPWLILKHASQCLTHISTSECFLPPLLMCTQDAHSSMPYVHCDFRGEHVRTKDTTTYLPTYLHLPTYLPTYLSYLLFCLFSTYFYTPRAQHTKATAHTTVRVLICIFRTAFPLMGECTGQENRER
jgi:hypothetical protein